MLESYFLFRQMTNGTTKGKGMPSLLTKVVSWEITHPKSLDVSYSFKGFLGRKRSIFGDESEGRTHRWRGYKGVARDTGEQGGGEVGSHQHLSAKRGPVRGRLRQPSLLLAGTMWSSLLPLSSFWGALFHTQTVAVAPTHPAKRCIQTGIG